MKREPTPWHAEAAKMRNDGASIRDIADALSKSGSTVRWCLNEGGQREQTRLGVRARLQRKREAKGEAEAKIKAEIMLSCKDRRPRDGAPAWHFKAIELDAAGVSVKEIARRFDRSRFTVRCVLDPVYREHQRLRKKGSRDTLGVESAARPTAHERRPIRRIISEPSEIMKAAIAFARGRITRDQLMQRIAP